MYFSCISGKISGDNIVYNGNSLATRENFFPKFSLLVFFYPIVYQMHPYHKQYFIFKLTNYKSDMCLFCYNYHPLANAICSVFDVIFLANYASQWKLWTLRWFNNPYLWSCRIICLTITLWSASIRLDFSCKILLTNRFKPHVSGST